MDLYEVIRKPIVTEKAEAMREGNVFAFEVSPRANKTLVKAAVRKIYGVTPKKVNIVTLPVKEKRNRMGVGFKKGKKKAYVFLGEKDKGKIEIFEGV